MELSAIQRMAELEEQHWWFVARRRIFATLIAELNLPEKARILEIGSGTGGNIGMLRQFGDVTGIEPSPEARSYAAEKSIQLQDGILPKNIKINNQSFDLICLFDVLEHVDKDVDALLAIQRFLAPSGLLLVAVPAMPWLWSAHDQWHHHHRRYTANNLIQKINNAGYSIVYSSYFNFFLFLPILLQRGYKRLMKRDSPDDTMASPWMNGVLQKIFSSERLLLKRRWRLPFGVSLLVIARCNEK